MATMRELWKRDAGWVQNGICDDCGAGGTVARQERARKFQCLECFVARPTGPALLRKIVRRQRRAERTTTPAATPAGAHELHAGRRLEGKAA